MVANFKIWDIFMIFMLVYVTFFILDSGLEKIVFHKSS